MRASLGQQSGKMLVGGGGLVEGALVSIGVSGIGQSRLLSCRLCSRCRPAACVHGRLQVGHAGQGCRAMYCRAHPRWSGCSQPGHQCALSCWSPWGSISRRQMAQVDAAGGVVAPCCVQSGGLSVVRSMGALWFGPIGFAMVLRVATKRGRK